jgi:cytochrome c biogenesis protein CcdA
MSAADTDLATVEAAYRKILRTILGHSAFFIVCCVIAIVLRKMFRLPPALLTVAFFVALVLFGGDLIKFLQCRSRLRRLREQHDTSP